jgi:hypothetical protein
MVYLSGMKNIDTQKLIFVYNATSGFRNSFIDSAHKIFSPKTYECSLCDITFGIFKERAIWKKFRLETKREMVFLHKDEFTKMYRSKFGHKFTFPIVLTETSQGLEILLKTSELNAMETAEDLIGLIATRS